MIRIDRDENACVMDAEEKGKKIISASAAFKT